jgi:hypothetical protein
MRRYQGLPAAASIEQAIILAQLLTLRDMERRAQGIPERSDQGDRAVGSSTSYPRPS